MAVLRTTLLAALTGAALVPLAACGGASTSATPLLSTSATTSVSTGVPSSTSTTTSLSAGPSTPAGSASQPPSSSSTPVVTESNPPGDIPDNQAYVGYRPAGGGVEVKVPEGWARSVRGSTTSFTDKLNRIEITTTAATALPSPAAVTGVEVPRLQKATPSLQPGRVTSVERAAGRAVLLTFNQDSNPDPVTGKVVRDAVERYTFVHAGTRVDLSLVGPVNADNVDPWRTVSDSLRWLR